MDSPSPVKVPPATPPSGHETKAVSVSDEEGFVSGDEEFEVAPESLVPPISDDAADSFDSSKLKVQDEGKVGDLNGHSSVFHDLDDIGSAVVGDAGGGGIDDKALLLADDGDKELVNAEKEDVLDLVNRGASYAEVVKLSGDDDASALVSKQLEGAGEVEVKQEDGRSVPEVADVKTNDVAVAKSNSTVDKDKDELSFVEPDVVEVDGVKLTPEGDAIVDAIDVEVKVPGIAVVGKAVNVEPAKVEQELPVDEPVVATVNTDETNHEELKSVEPDMVEVPANAEPAKVEKELPVDVPVVATGNTVEARQKELKSSEPDVVEVDGIKFTPEGDSVVDSIDADVKVPGIAVVGKADSPKVEEEVPVDEPFVATANTDEESKKKLKTVDSDVVEVDGMKLTPEGDSVVDAINADVKIPGIAVVGKAASSKVEEEVPVHDPVVATVNTDEESQKDLKTVDSDVVEVDGVKLTPEGDSVVDAINADVKIPGVAIVGESHESAAAEPASNEKLDMIGNVHGSTIAHDTETVDTNNIETPEVLNEELEATESMETQASKEPENGNELDRNENLVDSAPVVAKDAIVDSDAVLRDNDSDEPQLPDTNQSVAVDDDAVDIIVGAQREMKNQGIEEADYHGSASDGETDGLIFGSSEAAKQFIEQLEQGSGSDRSHHLSHAMDGQVVTDSDDEVDTDDEGEAKELLDPSALAALLKAATGTDADGGSGGNITITSEDGTRLFSVERPAGLGSSLRALRPNPRQAPLNMFAPSTTIDAVDSEVTLSDEEKKTFEKFQQIRVKYLRLIHRLGLSPDESVAAQVLYRLMLILGRQGGRAYTVDAAKHMALQLEAKENDLDLSVNILVLGKCGVGKSATINSIFGEEKARIDAFQPATEGVREIVGFVNGVKLRVFDTPGLKCSIYEQSFNRSILSFVKRATKKHPLDIVLYVDRMDSQTRDMNDVPLLKTISSSLGSSIWKQSIITLTHAASAPPDGPSGIPLSYEVFATQRSHVLQQSVSSAAGDVRMMNPSLMHPIALVENHPSCRKNREGQKVLPNGLSWRPQLLLLCFSLKILSEVNSVSKPQDVFDHRKIFGFRGRAPPLPYMLSSMLQSRPHPKLPNEQGGDNGDSDIDLDYFSDPDQDEEDEYDQLPPFKPLKKSQVAKLSKEQKKEYFEEYDYRVKLLQKKQLKDELKRMKEMKNRGKDATVDYGYMEEDVDSGVAAPVAVPLPDMVLPPSFDSDNPAYRYRFLEPTSQFLARPVLDSHGWDHDCGYDGVNVEQGLAVANRFPAAVTFQITKDKKDFTISLDSSVSAKHGENGSTMAGFDIQSLGKQLAYTLRGETKFKILEKNKTSGGISVTFLGENIVPGAKLEDQITIGKQYVLVGSAGAVRSDRDTAYGANFELQRREADFPIGQAQSSISMSLIRWRGDLALGFNTLFQFSVGRGSKMTIRAGLNNKLSGQISVKTSSSEHLSLALTALIPIAASIYKKLQPSAPEQYSIY